MNPAAVFARLDRELWVVTSSANGQRGGLIATFVNQASVVPGLPRIVLGVAHQHYTAGLIESSNAFALHLIGEQHIDWVWRFGLRSGRGEDKLDGLAVTDGPTGSPLLRDALAWLDCRVEARMDTGDKTLYLATVIAGESLRPEAPLCVSRMIALAEPERRKQLKEQLERASAIEMAAIETWRRARGKEKRSSARFH
jgi:flavin reductase (DIM6/NTAB) family NADH-FMN oxidoreductase RutF